jgi:hypothetical protein
MRLTSFTAVLAGMGVAALSAGCPNREVSRVDPNQDKVEQKEIPLTINRNIDILFVIDNSRSMKEEQETLQANFPTFISVLEQIDGGLPNVHLGVVSSDMGTLVALGDANCSDSDNGTLLKGNPDMPGLCPEVNGNYIADEDQNADGVRETNYTGVTLAQAFSCMADLGDMGCGFEQHFESMRAALDGGNPANNTFLRSNAYLAVVFIADEDDCSAEDPNFFGPESAQLGPVDSFRCFEKAVRCNEGSGADLRDVGVKTGCQVDDTQGFLYTVNEYVEFLKGLKQDPRSVIVAGIIGPTEPVEVGRYTPMGATMERPDQVPSCTYVDMNGESNFADPGIRLRNFFEQFVDRNTYTTICDDDYSDALFQIADLLRTVIGYPCISAQLADTDPATDGIQWDCQFSYVTNPGEVTETETVLPECVGPVGESTNKPCWRLVTDAENCSDTPTQLSVVTEDDGTPPVNTFVKGGCVVE